MIVESKIWTYQLKDSAADSKLKLLKEGEVFGVEKPGGEKRIHIGPMANEAEYDKFFFPDNVADVVFEVSKLDLIQYLLSAKDEFLHPSQRYRMPINTYYEDLLKDTISKVSDIFYIRFIKNCDDKRYYITRPAGDKWATNYTFISQICLPLVSRFNFIRNKYDDNTYKFYLKPIFVGQMKEASAPSPREIKTLQQIYYGAPGTGKSYEIDLLTQGESVVRTTFHPDSDYSTFVGTYKPIMQEVPVMTTIGTQYVSVKDSQGNSVTERRIEYNYIPQAFLQAYVKAWKLYEANPDNPQKQFLVIEEINRGNCAQIFGDLFQLLDRNSEGFSRYDVWADADMQKYIASQNLNIAELYDASGVVRIEDKINSGELLSLPCNLYIWATMNTSDQSLFPIDSAFKRRWDWVYVPIDTKKEVWSIKVNGQSYSWGSFLEKINGLIWSTTSSEDKKLGFYFCKAENGIISADKFVSKVLFYLYNDVFKTYGFDNADCFKHDDKNIEFYELYLGFKKVNEPLIAEILDKLSVDKIETED